MRKIITKSLTRLALAGAVALPLIASSSAYGKTDTLNSNNLQNSESSDAILLAVVWDQSGSRQCTILGNRGVIVRDYIKSCLYSQTKNKINPDFILKNLGSIRAYGMPGSPAYKGGEWNKTYLVLINKANLRPKNTWAGFPKGPK